MPRAASHEPPQRATSTLARHERACTALPFLLALSDRALCRLCDFGFPGAASDVSRASVLLRARGLRSS
eukprot:839125-Alexandrium_andersonii.AAC.1